MSGRPRGFGFITMSTAEEAQKAHCRLERRAVGWPRFDGSQRIAKPREGAVTRPAAVAAAVVVNTAAAVAAQAVANATKKQQKVFRRGLGKTKPRFFYSTTILKMVSTIPIYHPEW